MSDGMEFKLEGLDSLLSKLTEVTNETKFKGGRSALRKAAQVVRNRARENAERINDPDTPELISANIVERWNGRLFKRTGDLGFRVGVLGGARKETTEAAKRKTERRRARLGQQSLSQLGEIGGSGKKNPGGDTWYWRLVEFGTSKTKARPFIRPAMDSSKTDAINAFVSEYEKAIDRAIRKAAKINKPK